MSMLLITPLILVGLLAIFRGNYDKYAPIAIVSVLSYISYSTYEIGAYDQAVETFGYYGYQAIYPLASILLLAFCRNNTATALIYLFFATIMINLAAFLIESALSVDMWALYQVAVFAAYLAELAILSSQRVTDGTVNLIHRAFQRIAKTFNLDSQHRGYWAAGGIGETKRQ